MNQLERVEIHLYRNCNLKCTMCDFKEYTDKIPDMDTMGRLIVQLKDMKVKIVHFTGGEVLLYPEAEKLFRCVYESGMKLHMTTNGVLLDMDEKRKAVADFADKLQISIDHHKSNIHNMLRGADKTLEKVLAGVKKLKSEKPDVHLAMNTVLSRHNIDFVAEMLELCKEYGFSVFNPIPVKGCVELLPSKSQIEVLLCKEEELRTLAEEQGILITSPNFHIFHVQADKDAYNRVLYEEGCTLLKNQVFINMTSGEVLPCPMTMYRNKENVLIGNIFDTELSHIWNSERTEEVRRFFADTDNKKGKACYDFCDPAFCCNQLVQGRKESGNK
ncbi:MAG: radical SAM protein [Hungatella sp.]|nr:radical SAM protein [Hungatella sp.]